MSICTSLAVAPARAPAREHSAPVLATEDSIRQYALPDTVLVKSPRIPLLDIIRKAKEGEKHKFDGINTLAFTRVVKVTITFESPAPRTEVHEIMWRVYFQAPDRWKNVRLKKTEIVIEADGRRHPKEKKKPKGVNLSFSSDDSDDDDDEDMDEGGLADLPDYLDRLDRYDFEILHRSLRPDQVVYEIGFKPRSDFELLPEGRMWVLTRGYQLVREELRFKQLPMPGILKKVDLVTREWQEVENHWVEKRITARAELGLPKLLRAPKSIEVVVAQDQYVFNPALDTALFGGKKP